jgi:hypothetical protein
MNIDPKVWDVFEKACVPVIVAVITYVITKKQATNTIVIQSRQKWIDDLRNCISLYIAKAEMISMLELDDDQYFDHFTELSQTQNKIALMLNTYEKEHNGVIIIMEEIRELIHEEDIDEDELEKSLDKKIVDLLKVAQGVLKNEWSIIKTGK